MNNKYIFCDGDSDGLCSAACILNAVGGAMIRISDSKTYKSLHDDIDHLLEQNASKDMRVYITDIPLNLCNQEELRDVISKYKDICKFTYIGHDTTEEELQNMGFYDVIVDSEKSASQLVYEHFKSDKDFTLDIRPIIPAIGAINDDVGVPYFNNRFNNNTGYASKNADILKFALA
ncbi:MAG: hypothetical protein KAS12_03090, partial [Candidatus Aenigmarchaeota archaeon]|nr:hypothetical protein [Candidatus Aenigmarchaeota archaeon]